MRGDRGKENYEEHPDTVAEIQATRAEYDEGEYQTFDEYYFMSYSIIVSKSVQKQLDDLPPDVSDRAAEKIQQLADKL